MDSTPRRSFYCPDNLWQAFASLAMQYGTSVDALINDAMVTYLQTRQPSNMQAQPVAQNMQAQPIAQNMQAQPVAQNEPGQPLINMTADRAYPSNGNSIPPAPMRQNYPPTPPTPPPTNAQQPMGAARMSIQPPPMGMQQPLGARVPPPTPAYRRPPSIFEESPVDPSMPPKPMVLASCQNEPPQYPHQPAAPVSNSAYSSGAQQPLFIIFANQRYTVDKDKYIIGRSSQLADLVIRDANISRKHCAIIYKNGAYYIKDLDSTNGIEYKGNRIDTKRIDEGDQFNICDFHFTFTYR